METLKNEPLENFVARINILTQTELSRLGRIRKSYLIMAMHCKKMHGTVSCEKL